MKRLEGKTALITGAGSGIGAAIARRFRAEGARVAVNDIDKAAAERLARELEGPCCVADVTDSRAVARMFQDLGEAFDGQLDVLVNNAGIGGLENDPALAEKMRTVMARQAEELMTQGRISTHWDLTETYTDEQWHRMLAVHLDGTFFCSREALKLMGPRETGCILNMGSIMGTASEAGAIAYCTAKAGILGFTRSLAREVASRNIRVNAVAPGWIDTPMTAPLGEVRSLLAARTPLGRFGTPDDIAWAAVYLASDEAAFVTGQVLSPNGGWYMSQ